MASDVRFAVVKKLLEQHGWEEIRVRGSHHRFKRKGGPSFTIPVHNGKVGAVYLRQIEKAIEAIKRHEQEEADEKGA